jgi:hypothetical protein
MSEIFSAISDLVSEFEKHKLAYLVGGSIASSLHGIYRATNDIDVLLERPLQEKEPLLDDLSFKFLIDRVALANNHKAGGSYNIFHEATGIKVDLFPAKNDFHREEIRRAQSVAPQGVACSFKVASPEDCLLAKLLWHKKGGSERQLLDIQGIVRMEGGRLDRIYLDKWAGVLGVTELLQSVLKPD